MLLTSALTFAAFAGTAAPSAVDAFLRVCASAPSSELMEAAANARGWVKEDYPKDIRAGFLAELHRKSQNTTSVNYAEIYGMQVVEGPAYLIISRIEPILGSKSPRIFGCQLSIFDYKAAAPRSAMSEALGVQPTNPWRDEQGNEVLDWYGSQRFPERHIQMSRAVSRTSLAGPADLSGLSLSVEFSEKK